MHTATRHQRVKARAIFSEPILVLIAARLGIR